MARLVRYVLPTPLMPSAEISGPRVQEWRAGVVVMRQIRSGTRTGCRRKGRSGGVRRCWFRIVGHVAHAVASRAMTAA